MEDETEKEREKMENNYKEFSYFRSNQAHTITMLTHHMYILYRIFVNQNANDVNLRKFIF